eukprot:CAMPEP_0204303374 /NCGR_PEP_ID=MMETSP0468-20130131/83797_1 /ASSEMBLY_ACC=CAM_ASM_000383 /TAXON_ID=2969 /ORGANISM="Oxyrrhis marina" /LENGTH=73 /DNA_ID=CAMNT_0051282681 /DNA_START=155 /DNA_END=376 /DNA_ORIENTATION=-
MKASLPVFTFFTAPALSLLASWQSTTPLFSHSWVLTSAGFGVPVMTPTQLQTSASSLGSCFAAMAAAISLSKP